MAKTRKISRMGKTSSVVKGTKGSGMKAVAGGGKVYKFDFTILSKKPESHMTPIEKMQRLSIGISKKDLEDLKNRAELDYDKLAALLSVTRSTLINKQGSEKFNPTLGERIIGLADIYSYGYEVFEDEERFNQWMFRQNTALGGKTPYEICNNQFGREEVRNVIGRIDYGVYS
ncbi:type II RES/Xre toxin-antitoxin system antitoxin [Pinibacter aurantiacus]|uniref:MbcA/ParS/Xre antitoxin family protein n=1 Tax=Pinibacter aurantiacus TaxID=2851599 RepID=A0A9E2S9Z9_9BACT|nr:antitoxin Xre/MbcA/ParS toxin-binding domain-containing protein [Pinibacter aurantiacus]MBV4357374.1 MbcA/ParS/Xre antitoxin family protein [Pinibacter aurantiacus]